MRTQPKKASPATGAAANQMSKPMEETIRQRAYEIYERRGREDGHELDDWLQAESELAKRDSAAVAA